MPGAGTTPEPSSAAGAGSARDRATSVAAGSARDRATSVGAGGARGSGAMSDVERLRDRLRGALPAARKARDAVAVAALRSALAAIDNAEAVELTTPPGPTSPPGRVSPREPAPSREPAQPQEPVAPREPAAPPGQRGRAGHAEFAGTVVGLGAGEVQRRSLSEAEIEEIVRREVADREHAARTYAAAGRREPAERLRAEAEVLSRFLGGAGSPPG